MYVGQYKKNIKILIFWNSNYEWGIKRILVEIPHF